MISKTGQQIIDDFRTLIDSQDDLSDEAVLDIAQQVIDIIINDRDWNFLRKTATGTLTTSDIEYDLPTDFRGLTENYEDCNGFPQRILFVDTTFERYHWINMSQRRNFIDSNGYAYIDLRQKKFVLTKLEQNSRIFEYDYFYNPDDITLITSPIIPINFHAAISKLMAVLWADIDQTDRSFSYAAENNIEFQNYLADMQIQDAQSNNQFNI